MKGLVNESREILLKCNANWNEEEVIKCDENNCQIPEGFELSYWINYSERVNIMNKSNPVNILRYFFDNPEEQLHVLLMNILYFIVLKLLDNKLARGSLFFIVFRNKKVGLVTQNAKLKLG